ncbi:MAG: hypothetical protein ACLFUA_07560 [Spirochaetales bacterium]
MNRKGRRFPAAIFVTLATLAALAGCAGVPESADLTAAPRARAIEPDAGLADDAETVPGETDSPETASPEASIERRPVGQAGADEGARAADAPERAVLAEPVVRIDDALDAERPRNRASSRTTDAAARDDSARDPRMPSDSIELHEPGLPEAVRARRAGPLSARPELALAELADGDEPAEPEAEADTSPPPREAPSRPAVRPRDHAVRAEAGGAPAVPSAGESSGAPAVRRSETAPSVEPPGTSEANRAPSAPTAPAPAATPWNERAAEVARDGEISIVLPGSGWLYVGTEYGDGEISLLGKRRAGGDEVFEFRIDDAGDYGLWFQQQDAVTGSLANERLALRATEGDGASSVSLADLPVGGELSPQTVARSEGSVPNERARSAEGTGLPATRSSAAGQRDEGDDEESAVTGAEEPDEGPARALERARELLDGSDAPGALVALTEAVDDRRLAAEDLESDDARDLLVRLFDASSEMEASPVLRSFRRIVASSGSMRAPEARRALLEVAVDDGDERAMVEIVGEMEESGEANPDDLVRVGLTVGRDSGEDRAPELLARAIRMDGGVIEHLVGLSDERLFRLARFLERPGPERDMHAASALYSVIVDERPLSSYWDESRARLEYLSRHYFEVR